MESYQDRQQAEFNMSLSTLERINSMLVLANNAKIQHDGYVWVWALATARTELSPHMNDNTHRQYLKNKIRNLLIDVNTWVTRRNSSTVRGMPITLWNACDDFQEDILIEMRARGLLMKTTSMDELRLK